MTRDELEELELRLAQVEHRLRLVEGAAEPAHACPCKTEGVASGTKTRNLGRMSEIAQVAVKHGFGYFFSRNKLTDLLPGQEISPDGDASSERGRRLRETFDELGPTFVKFGQLLSTRPDVVPPDIVVELRKLQDDVSPFPFSQVEQVIAEELGQPIERLFVEFVEQPIAAASIGQVHEAVLPNGRRVAVKVQRPTAPRQIEADLALLYQAAKIAKDRVRALDFIDAQSLVDEFARSLREELDYRQEARNANTFHRNFAGHPHVRIPRVYWSYTGARVLTLEFLDGTKIADLQPGELSDDERRRLAYAMAEAWMTMVFRHGIFHGDPHPANILMLGHPERIGLVDFGQAGRLTDEDMSKLTALFIDAAAENVDALPKRLADLGVRYDKSARGRVRRAPARVLLALLRRPAVRDRPDPGHPRGLPAHLRDEPPSAVAVRAPGQGDRDARLRRRRALSGLQRLRGCEAVRARAHGAPLLTGQAGARRAERGA